MLDISSLLIIIIECIIVIVIISLSKRNNKNGNNKDEMIQKQFNFGWNACIHFKKIASYENEASKALDNIRQLVYAENVDMKNIDFNAEKVQTNLQQIKQIVQSECSFDYREED
jgi:hypothetical protein